MRKRDVFSQPKQDFNTLWDRRLRLTLSALYHFEKSYLGKGACSEPARYLVSSFVANIAPFKSLRLL